MNTLLIAQNSAGSSLAGYGVLGADCWGITVAVDRRFKRILSNVLGILVASLLLLTSWVIERPEVSKAVPEVPYALELLPVPIVKPAPPPEVPKPLPKSEEVTAPAKPKPIVEPVSKPVAVERQVLDAAAAAARRQAAQAAAAQAGVMAFSQQLAHLRGSGDRVLATEKSLRDRDLVTSESSVTTAKQLSAVKASAGHREFAERSVSDAQGSTAVGSHRTQTLAAVPARSVAKGSLGGSGNVKPSRSLEEIQFAFDRSKTAFYTIFNRAARKDSTIGTGTVIVSITIEADGSVSHCEIVSSSFFNPDLKQKLLQRVRMLKFEAKSVPAFTYPNYPISYVP